MKEAILILIAAAVAAYAGYTTGKSHSEQDLVELSGALQHAEANLAQCEKAIARLETAPANLQEEIDHLKEQLSKHQQDNQSLAQALAAAKSDAKSDAMATTEQIEAAVNPALPVNPVQPGAQASAPSAPPRDPNEAAARAAQIARLQQTLNQWQALRAQTVAKVPPFKEQTINPQTGRKSGTRTSDADRQKWHALQAQELARIDAAIRAITQDIAALSGN